MGLADLRRRCCALGIVRLEAGPKAVALEFQDDAALRRAAADLGDGGLDLRVRDRRLIVARSAADPNTDLPHLRHFLDRIEVSISAEKCHGRTGEGR